MKSKLFLDSGAYSAWTTNTKIDIQEYIAFIKEHKDSLEVYACLDDITDPDKTWENQETMEKAGLSPLPVYHTEEGEKYLKRAMTYPYFAVGGMALKGAVSRREQFNFVFSKVCTRKNDYYPTHKVHGFGLASPDLLISYPWYSADTTSWAAYSRFGIILIPRIINGCFRYDVPPYTIAISSRSKAIGDMKHFRNFSSIEQEWISNYCQERGLPLGRTLFKRVMPGYFLKTNEHWFDRKNKQRVEVTINKGLCCDGEMRDRLNLLYFLGLEKNQPGWPWAWKLYENQLFI
jgi:hypothetical protein